MPTVDREELWGGFVAFCANYRLPFRVLSAIAVFLFGGLASYALFQVDSILLAVILFAAAGIAEVVREKVGDELMSGRTAASRRRDARRLLRLASEPLIPEGAADELDDQGKLIRANLMVHDPYNGRLCVWESYNMEGDDDEELEMRDTSGVAGDVFHRCSDPTVFHYDESTDDPRSSVAPRPAHGAIRDELETILSVPIYRPYVQNRGSGPDEKIGILNFDSDLEPSTLDWNREEILNFSITIADLLAPTIER